MRRAEKVNMGVGVGLQFSWAVWRLGDGERPVLYSEYECPSNGLVRLPAHVLRICNCSYIALFQFENI